MSKPLVSIIMGSKSDLDTMQHAAEVLKELNIPYEMKIISAHRTPNLMFEYAAVSYTHLTLPTKA